MNSPVSSSSPEGWVCRDPTARNADVEAIVNIADVIASGIRGARKLVLPDTAHMINRERPAEFNRAVVEFLDEHPIAS